MFSQWLAFAACLSLVPVALGAREVVEVGSLSPDEGEGDDGIPAPTFRFYMYRATGIQFPGNNSDNQRSGNFANLAGVLGYIHRDVIGRNVLQDSNRQRCMRKYNVDRIVRYEVTMKSTPEAMRRDPSGFLPFVSFDKGRCNETQCAEKWWNQFGFVPGCNKQGDQLVYPDATWYSFPGRCPNRTFNEACEDKLDSFDKMESGGACRPRHAPTGAWNCTYIYEPKGHVLLDDLVSIKPQYPGYAAFCGDGGIEFNGPDDDDENVTLEFWKDYRNQTRNRERVEALEALFQEKYPEAIEFAEPHCQGPQPEEVVHPRGVMDNDTLATTTTVESGGLKGGGSGEGGGPGEKVTTTSGGGGGSQRMAALTSAVAGIVALVAVLA